MLGLCDCLIVFNVLTPVIYILALFKIKCKNIVNKKTNIEFFPVYGTFVMFLVETFLNIFA